MANWNWKPSLVSIEIGYLKCLLTAAFKRLGRDTHRFQPCLNFSESKRKPENFERGRLGSVTTRRSRTLTGRSAATRTRCTPGSPPTTPQTAAQWRWAPGRRAPGRGRLWKPCTPKWRNRGTQSLHLWTGKCHTSINAPSQNPPVCCFGRGRWLSTSVGKAELRFC